jgi:hypothetical protein
VRAPWQVGDGVLSESQALLLKTSTRVEHLAEYML